MNYKHYSTDEYDGRFEDTDGLHWLPWVGKNYHETRILIIGASTDNRDGGDWTKDPKWGGSQNASRVLVSGVDDKDASAFDPECYIKKPLTSFDATVKMFLPEMDIKQARQPFWSAVAFNNFCQVTIDKREGKCPCQEESVQALQATMKILKPELVIAWTTVIRKWCGFGADEEFDTIAGGEGRTGKPRIAYPTDQSPAVAGILHPSRHINDGKEWSEFLQTNEYTRKPIANFMDYLQRQPSNQVAADNRLNP